MPANCQLGGIDYAACDVCVTPPGVPIPYSNFALGATAVPNVLHILFSAMPAHNMGTIVPFTLGDSPGVLGGVCSGTCMGPSRHITGVVTFLLAGLPATRLASLTQQNLTNAPGIRTVPSQFTIWLLGL
ncbi:type VI secretion protein [Chania multitudinisentens RB-25]|uniref:Type VI secretion protein n=1 Tax=Chania multitudinisentens RB-25 TaxID=1441930 RepID=W0LAU7_9GAMM|nr:DUF4150 domain-containing protein [Chania multitudinisentens]AHG20958.1 type VI secretion protein [Chania multitudinisentens RB-25]